VLAATHDGKIGGSWSVNVDAGGLCGSNASSVRTPERPGVNGRGEGERAGCRSERVVQPGEIAPPEHVVLRRVGTVVRPGGKDRWILVGEILDTGA